MHDLRALLGDRYDAVIDKAMAAPKFYATRQYTIRDRVADTLAAVLPDLLAEARAEGWDEGVAVALDRAIRNPDGITLRLEHLNGDPWSNPYRTEETR